VIAKRWTCYLGLYHDPVYVCSWWTQTINSPSSLSECMSLPVRISRKVCSLSRLHPQTLSLRLACSVRPDPSRILPRNAYDAPQPSIHETPPQICMSAGRNIRLVAQAQSGSSDLHFTPSSLPMVTRARHSSVPSALPSHTISATNS
jgi:hypothetical protein